MPEAAEDGVANTLLPQLYDKLDTMRTKLSRSNKALKVKRQQVQISSQRIAELEDELPKLRGDRDLMQQSHEKLVSTIVEVQRAYDRIVQSGKALSRLMDADSERCDRLAGPDACALLPQLAKDEFYAPFAKPGPGFISVCPGDELLFVFDGSNGGGALNGAFGKALKACGHEAGLGESAPGAAPAVGSFQELHGRGFREAHRQPEALVEVYDRKVPHLDFAGCRTWRGADRGLGATFGTAFLNICSEAHRPEGSLGFLYVVGPLGTNARAPGESEPPPERQRMVIADKTEFLQFLTRTSRSLLEAVNEYNVHCLGKDLPRIETMRVPLISAGVFRHPEVEEAQVAGALLLGLREAWQRGTSPSLSLVPGFKDAYEATKQSWAVL